MCFGQFGTSRSGEKCSKFRERRVGSLPSELAVTAKNSTTVTNCGFNLTAPGVLSARWFGADFPIGTLAVNIVGSAILGLIVVLFTKLNIANQDARLFLATGVIGGFTTFSTFSLDTVALWERGDHFGAAGYVGASVVLSLAAIVVAMWLLRRFV